MTGVQTCALPILKFRNEQISAKNVLYEAVQAEKGVLLTPYSWVRKNQLFEKKYKISSQVFLRDCTTDNLEGKDIEYVEWNQLFFKFSLPFPSIFSALALIVIESFSW